MFFSHFLIKKSGETLFSLKPIQITLVKKQILSTQIYSGHRRLQLWSRQIERKKKPTLTLPNKKKEKKTLNFNITKVYLLNRIFLPFSQMKKKVWKKRESLSTTFASNTSWKCFCCCCFQNGRKSFFNENWSFLEN